MKSLLGVMRIQNFLVPRRVHTFLGEKDRFNGITVDTSKIKCDESMFKGKLEESLKAWSDEGRRCIWFKVGIKDSSYIPALANKGFDFHHARDSYVMMYKWLPMDSAPNLPPAPHTNVGVGAMVFNSKNQILAVSEKHYNYPHWKLPGGYVERGEFIPDAAKREVREETGVEAEYESLVTFRHTHNMMFDNSDIYVLLTLNAVCDTIAISQREVRDCQWMDVEDYINHPHVHKWNRVVVEKAFEYKKKGLKLNLLEATVQFQVVRHINYLVVEDRKD